MTTVTAVLVMVLVGLLMVRESIRRAKRIAAMGDFYKCRAVPKTTGDAMVRDSIGWDAPRYPMAPEDVLA